MKEAFEAWRPAPDSAALVQSANSIVEKYQAKGLTLTLRQLYYQHVAANIIPNIEEMYDKLGKVVANARMAGLLDWEAIEDRVRVPWKMPDFEDVEELVEAAINTHRLPRWRGQDNYVELMIEKDALSGVLMPLAVEYHVTMNVNRGYSSMSALYECSKRLLKAQSRGERCHILYAGDMDPSGVDMTRDVRDRLKLMGTKVEVHRIALNIEQVEQYNPPPNPAKLSDSRAKEFIAQYGHESWELDALPPDVLQGLFRDALDELVDREKMDEIVKKEEVDKKMLRKIIAKKPKAKEGVK